MALLDVNALVALAWDSHVHHASIRRWFQEHGEQGWATCPVTESGFVRVSSNPRVLPAAISINDSLYVLSAMRSQGAHRFLTDDVSPLDEDVPRVHGYRQVTDARLLALAARNGLSLVTFDAGIPPLAVQGAVELLSAL